jgi:isopentenyl-diphosphate delta-isomerase
MSDSFDEFETRKQDHIRLALDAKTQGRVGTHFEKIRLTHNALPEIDFHSISLKKDFFGQIFSSPHFVSSMTAGHRDSLKINKNLAFAAFENNWVMAVGSQRRELTDKFAAREWLNIKSEIPDLKLISNIGILELMQFGAERVLSVVDNLNAIAIYIHFNPLQEVFQNNQNLNFKGALESLQKLCAVSPVPVLVKEVGFGINKNLAQKLFDLGVSVVDVAGHGGTHWGLIEAYRHDTQSIFYKSADAFADWGYSTVECLLQLQDLSLFNQVWASGGVRNGVESAKCLSLGARAVGIAQPLMAGALESAESVSLKMKEFDFQLKTAMFCMGISNCEEFLHKKVWHGTEI